MGTVERGFDPDKGGGYCALVREQVQKAPLSQTVREPTMVDAVLRSPSPSLPGPTRQAIRDWLRTTPLPDRTLPASVRQAMIAEIKKLQLAPELEGNVLVVRLPDATRVAIEKILGDAKHSEPQRSGVYDWWLANFDKGELHHVWPKWLLGDEGQVCLRLPRCIHNMSGVGLDDGGFHQRLNALFAQSERFKGLTVENARGFRDALRDATKNGERIEFLADAHNLLVEVYESTIGAPSIISPIKLKLEAELKRISEKK